MRDKKSVKIISQDEENKEYENEQGKYFKLFYSDTEELNGTLVKFAPNKKYFGVNKIDLEYIKNKCKICNALGYKVNLSVIEKGNKEDIDISSDMFGLINESSDESISIYKDIDLGEVKDVNGEFLRCVLRYTSDTTDRYFGFTNMTQNTVGGTHITMLYNTIINAWETFIEKKRIKLEVDLRKSDYVVGLRGVIAIFIQHPAFSSQTKEKLVIDKRELNSLSELLKDKIVKVLYEDEALSKALIKRFTEYRIAQNKLLARKDIASVIKVNEDSSDNIRRRSIVSKLRDCLSKKKEGSEMFIVEGNSAMSPFLLTRDKQTQAVLPLRGKILNITNREVKDALKNAEICDIANAIGAGIGSMCDPSKSRYERVIISCDSDPDGAQITCLVLSVFVNLFPDLVKEGLVYFTLPPLYTWYDNSLKRFVGCMKPEDIPDGVKAHRIKGLGELDDKEMHDFLINPATRNLIQVEYPTDIDKFNRILGSAAGKSDLMKELGIVQEAKEDI